MLTPCQKNVCKNGRKMRMARSVIGGGGISRCSPVTFCFTKIFKINLHIMKPIADRVIIKPAPADEKTKGGLIIPDTAKEKPQRGEVIAVGSGKDGNLMTVQVGDIVLYGKYSGQEINYEGQDYLIMREDDVLCII